MNWGLEGSKLIRMLTRPFRGWLAWTSQCDLRWRCIHYSLLITYPNISSLVIHLFIITLIYKTLIYSLIHISLIQSSGNNFTRRDWTQPSFFFKLKFPRHCCYLLSYTFTHTLYPEFLRSAKLTNCFKIATAYETHCSTATTFWLSKSRPEETEALHSYSTARSSTTSNNRITFKTFLILCYSWLRHLVQLHIRGIHAV